MITRRGWGAVAGGLFGLLAAFFTLNLLLFLIGVVILSFVAAELLAFAWATRGFSAEWFTVQRSDTTTQVASRGSTTMRLRLRNGGRCSFWAEIYDSLPDSFQVLAGSPRLLTWWGSGEELTLAYVVRPLARGQHAMGPTLVVAHDSLGLAFRAAALSGQHSVTVTPAGPQVGLGHYGAKLL